MIIQHLRGPPHKLISRHTLVAISSILARDDLELISCVN